ncbi:MULTISPECIES: tyrosine-type recombinase/integrase [Prevotella]|jgi:site-specific recombinase, phage integrase family|uniref:tyrosine-type recombinase/integrase n=1 Tax=Prevotella bivia TaxID=28125 RepID=UPI000777FE32|nr:tyrosine-type recombinase/integrase [Prevotella bivia]KXU59762.1 site-specific recombinase, phage integrase family [Prevotella bivia]
MAKQEVVVIYDRKKVAAKRGKGKVEVRVYISRTERKYISLGDVAPDELENFVSSSKVLAIKKRCEQILAAMSVLDDKLSVEKFDSYYYETGDNPFAKSKNSVNFLQYMEQSIKQENIREGTRKHKICTLEAIRRFGQIKTTKDLTRENLVAFDQWLRDGTRSDVAINNYHKNIRIYTKRLATENVINIDPYDLVKFKRGKCKEREPLSEAELKKLRTIKLEGKLDKVRDLFVFAAYTGLAYCDVQSFSFDTMTELQGTLYYIDGSRLKTGSKFFTPILKPAMEVLKKYDFKLPRISNQKANDYLHLIQAAMKLNKNLTFHIARHSFATLALAHDVPIENVARMLGHQNIRTTQIYAKVLKSTIERHAVNLQKAIR